MQVTANMLTEGMLDSLRRTRPWVVFLAILGFIFTAFMLLAGIWVFAAFSIIGAIPAQQPLPRFFGPVLGFGVGAAEIVAAVFMYLLPCIILFRYGSAIGRMAPGNIQWAVEEALARQKSFWKYLGILMIVLLILYVLLFVGILVAAGVLAVQGVHAVPATSA
ncbi:MAG TPA: hypothetical protein VJS89_09660 [Gammaproteobacteria bacterium]|nr:hypothetical protein [Gammaproteobacteria bacterium]